MRCLKCDLEFGDHVPDYCPVCCTIPFVCPWCGVMTDASARCCTAEGCGQPIKYIQIPPDYRDVMRLRRGEAVQISGVTVVVERALYAAERATVYRAKVVDNINRRKPEPAIGSAVAVREVVDLWSPQVEALLPKLIELKHPNVVRTYAGAPDTVKGCYRLLQSWVGEKSLANAHLEEHGGHAATPAELKHIAPTLAAAVKYLHSQGILHCDVTPFNVLIGEDGRLVISDFGIAELSENPGAPRGYASSYAPVELYPQFKLPSDIAGHGWKLGEYTDRYMLGATLYAIACGHDGRAEHPVTRTSVLVPAPDRLRYERGLGGTPQAPLRALAPDVSERFAGVIESLLSVAPEKRLKSDADMVRKVRSASKSLGKQRWFRFRRSRRLGRPTKVAAALVGLALLVFLSQHSYTLISSPSNLPTFALADAASLFGSPEWALRELNSAPRTSAEVDYAKGRALERMGRPDEALEAYKSSTRIDAEFRPAQTAASRARTSLGEASLQLGLQLYASGEDFEAYEKLTKAVHCGTCSVRGYRVLADIAEKRGKLADAAQWWDKTSKLQPSAVRPHYEAALLFIDSGNLEKAYHHTAKARDLRIRPTPEEDVSPGDMQELLDEVTKACLRAGQIDVSRAGSVRSIYEKLVWVNRARNLEPSTPVFTRLGRYYERLGDLSPGDRRANYYDRAVDCLNRARKLDPKSPSVNDVLARCLAKQKRVNGESAG